MRRQPNISVTRRRFLNTGIRLAAISTLVLPIQKALASGTSIVLAAKKKLERFLWIDKLVLNTKTRVVHLPSGKIFSKYPTIKRQAIIGSANWEVEVKPPYRFHKEKSGIIIEMLTLTRVSAGINDRALTDAYRILSVAFGGVYKNKTGEIINKYNFRLHHLLLQVISLNNTVPASQKWGKFLQATGNIDYSQPDKKPLPRFMTWLKSKTDFDKKANYILQNKSTYTTRLAARAARYKL